MIAIPSAIVGVASTVTGSPARSDAGNAAEARTWTPTSSTDASAWRRIASAVPPEQPAPAQRDDDLGQIVDLVEQFLAQRRLAGDHVEVVERGDERQLGIGVRAFAGQRDAFVHRLAAERHLRAQRLGGGGLGQRSVLGHVHLAAQAPRACGVGQRLSVVAGAAGDHAGRAATQGGGLAQRAAQLERAGPLEVLGLQGHRAAAPAR